MKKINLEMSQDQYEKLVETVFLGTWMVNSTQLELDESFEGVRNLVLSKFKEAELEDKVTYEEAFDVHDLAVDFENQLLQKYVEDYDEFSFWDKLVEKLSEKELVKEFGSLPDTLSEEMIAKRVEYEEEIGKELEERGITNLELKSK
ncbi:hypothetical protein MUO14_20035 [Halobacillus shinanisalinarum]|uniref:Uncharacterized protein n=1 Tax=Halobacillus shinanisalinarum TaxID=2932258 RepID=A0ABY4GXR0_9BACI|nr:hypothetical protein [Halobacillus shinanisalinarum]UOQ92684.1 hypothetical protein MUO14_20035 [Halobacillus shinanisalinarum]